MRFSTLVDWALAPPWISPVEAARLMGPDYTPASIQSLIDIGAIDTNEASGLVSLASLREYFETFAELAT